MERMFAFEKSSTTNPLSRIWKQFKKMYFFGDGTKDSNFHQRRNYNLLKIFFTNGREFSFFAPLVKLSASKCTGRGTKE
jgi:hypothetical protein